MEYSGLMEGSSLAPQYRKDRNCVKGKERKIVKKEWCLGIKEAGKRKKITSLLRSNFEIQN